jgi:hypothetical protein
LTKIGNSVSLRWSKKKPREYLGENWLIAEDIEMMIRRILLGILILLAQSVPSRAIASVGLSNVKVRIALVDKLVVSNGGTITLDSNDTNPTVSGALGPDTDATARLSFVHNKNVNKKITAQATSAPGAVGNDIKLEVQIGAGSFATLYDDAGAAAVQNVRTGLGAGALTNQVVTYRAQATAGGTPLGAQTDYDFTITYTSVDE